MIKSVCVHGAGRLFRPAPLSLLAAAIATAAVAPPAPAQAQGFGDIPGALRSADIDNRDIRSFYQARGWRPLWVRGGELAPEAFQLLELIDSASLDGVDSGRLRPGRLDSALRRAESGSPRELARAEVALSEAFANYIQAIRRPRAAEMRYESEALAPVVPTKKAALDAAAAAPSLAQYFQTMGWMHPLYAQLRAALANPSLDGEQDALLRVNMDRVRAIPANPSNRYVLVDAASARLWMYENGKVKDTMRVVVGKADQQTPMMAGFIRHAITNPYWNVPPDLVASKIAPAVLKEGAAHLRVNRYEILSDWTDNARVLDPASIDWRAVAAGRRELRVRQLPGKSNSMGAAKFMFPNDLGIYLHDTPDKHLMKRAERQLSSGCVRLEDAARFARWLFKKPLVAPSKAPEQTVVLPEPVPVYITYFTALPEAGRIAYRSDVYRRDQARLASLNTGMRGTR
ncbi:MAG TPA: L,D-transpeptidase family protein [Allosphingosinicella sp.]|jgi:murein L,D-transpeptidase YcbB/YkuD